jgi:hypothetical protein
MKITKKSGHLCSDVPGESRTLKASVANFPPHSGRNRGLGQTMDTESSPSRNTGPMLSSARCGAKTRAGKPCQSPAVNGKKRCRMHGGAPGSGAPIGNQNARKHGRYTARSKDVRHFFAALRAWERSVVQARPVSRKSTPRNSSTGRFVRADEAEDRESET